MTSISSHFEQQYYATYCTLETLLLKAAKRDDFSQEIKEVGTFYDDDIDMEQLFAQLKIFGSSLHIHKKIMEM